MSEKIEKTIDIDNMYVPRFASAWLKHIVHQDQVNEFLHSARDLKGVPWLDATLKYLDITLKVEGEENLPPKDDGKLYTFVSNHPLGGIDGVAIGSVVGHHYDGNFRYLVNDLLMNLPGQRRDTRHSVEKDVHHEERAEPARRGANTFRRPELKLFLPAG